MSYSLRAAGAHCLTALVAVGPWPTAAFAADPESREALDAVTITGPRPSSLPTENRGFAIASTSWSASVGIDDLNNEKYWAFHPYPQRTFLAELGYDL